MNSAQMDAMQDALLDSCRLQMIEEGKLVLTDAGYELTERGRQAVERELRRYEFRPAMAMMIEIYVLNRHECPVW